MRPSCAFTDFLVRQWILVASGIGLILTSLYAGRLPRYSADEMQVLFILLVQIVTVNGLAVPASLPGWPADWNAAASLPSN